MSGVGEVVLFKDIFTIKNPDKMEFSIHPY